MKLRKSIRSGRWNETHIFLGCHSKRNYALDVNARMVIKIYYILIE